MELMGDIESLPESNKKEIRILYKARCAMMIHVYQLENHLKGTIKENPAIQGIDFFYDQLKDVHLAICNLYEMDEFRIHFPILSENFNAVSFEIQNLLIQRNSINRTNLPTHSSMIQINNPDNNIGEFSTSQTYPYFWQRQLKTIRTDQQKCSQK